MPPTALVNNLNPLSLAIGFGVLILVIALVRSILNRPKPEPAREIELSVPELWGARFTVASDAVCCDKAKALNGHELRNEQLPPLPLPGCDVGNCTCSLEPLVEQRDNVDRRDVLDRRKAIRYDTERSERRSGDDRRKDNITWRGP
jgi:hypothetical protein